MIPDALLSAFRSTLIAGDYNLLLGSGISLDSRNGRGALLRSSETLRQDLCRLTGAPGQTTLSRAYALLEPDQRHDELVLGFSRCAPGPSLFNVPHFVWRRALTFNVDDALEVLYETSHTNKQTLIPLNFDSPFEPTPDHNELQSVHLHGFARFPDSGFVFSAAEYARVMRSLNPWMHLLSEILATEPFIIAGTSLNEIDLEYYLSNRSPATPRRGHGPSLLIEPYPDVATRSDCARYGLQLVEASFEQFLAWLRALVPSPPSIAELLVPDTTTLFATPPHPLKLLKFFSDFELVAGVDQPLPRQPTPFFYGREPDWGDLHQHVDIGRADYTSLSDTLIRSSHAKRKHDPLLFLVSDEAGTGKSTLIKRLAHDLARSGQPVLSVRTLSRIDATIAIECLSRLATPVFLLVDGIADHAEQLVTVLEDNEVARKVTIIAAERRYRQDHLDIILATVPRSTTALSPLGLTECEQLIERFRQFGLIGDGRAIANPQQFARKLVGDPIAIAICRILNDFRPLDAIVESLWNAAASVDRMPYVAVALAQYCYSHGLRYSILQRIVGPAISAASLFEVSAPLRIASNATADEFVVTVNSVLGDRVLHRSSRKEAQMLAEAFSAIASGLVPYVNRRAIMRRSPEARLAGRLFDADKVVRPLLGAAAEAFYTANQTQWEWNSRYWEQRALLAAEDDLRTALQYARHAVAIERHPFPLTTLGKLLLMSMESASVDRDAVFSEALVELTAAIEAEALRSRITVHPFATLLNGVCRYSDLGGALSSAQRDRIETYATEARHRFSTDVLIRAAVNRLDAVLG